MTHYWGEAIIPQPLYCSGEQFSDTWGLLPIVTLSSSALSIYFLLKIIIFTVVLFLKLNSKMENYSVKNGNWRENKSCFSLSGFIIESLLTWSRKSASFIAVVYYVSPGGVDKKMTGNVSLSSHCKPWLPPALPLMPGARVAVKSPHTFPLEPAEVWKERVVVIAAFITLPEPCFVKFIAPLFLTDLFCYEFSTDALL